MNDHENRLREILAANAAANYPDCDRSSAARSERARHQAYLARKKRIEGLGNPAPDSFEACLIRHLINGDITPDQYIVLLRQQQSR